MERNNLKYTLNKWSCLDASDEAPSPRVGHTCTAIKLSSGHSQILVIGGANPAGTYDDVYLYDPKANTWMRIQSTDLVGRYEFSAFVSKVGTGSCVAIFGGANEGGNRNDIQSLSLIAVDGGGQCCWNYVQCTGDCPSPRTQHNAVLVDGSLVVFGGGMLGTDPVPDRDVYMLRAADSTWYKLQTSGSPPPSRHGHITMGHGTQVYVHGGMAGEMFFDDLHVIDLKSGTWKEIVQETYHPMARASHGGVVHNGMVYVFGGLSKTLGSLSDFWMYDIDKNKWSEIQLQGAFPSPRLDFALCLVQCDDDQEKAFIFLHGGMNSSGDVFNDAYICELGKPPT